MKNRKELGVERLLEVGGIGHKKKEVKSPHQRSLERVGAHVSRALVAKRQKGEPRVAHLPLVRYQVLEA